MARGQKKPINPRDALHVWQAAFNVRDKSAFLENAYRCGYKAAPLWMVQMCRTFWTLPEQPGRPAQKLPLPEWASDAIAKACVAAVRGELKSWDEAFGNPIPQGKRATGLRTAAKQIEVYCKIRELHEEGGRSIGDDLFREVGKKFGLNLTTTKNLYSDLRRVYHPEGRKIVFERIKDPKAKLGPR